MPAIRDFARRMVASETAPDEAAAAGGAAGRVCEKLRAKLSNVVGVAGFRSLLMRAVALAKGDVPSLAAVRVLADGTLEGLDDLSSGQESGAVDPPGVVVVAQLLELLVTFIGESLTWGLVRDTLPGMPVPNSDSTRVEGS